MKRTVAVSLWDLSSIATCLLPLPLGTALAAGRASAALWYAGIWLFLMATATVAGRARGLSLRSYLAA